MSSNTPKRAMKLLTSLGVSSGGVFDGLKNAKVSEASVGPDLRAPLLHTRVPCHPLDAGSVCLGLALIPLIFRSRRGAEVAAPVVQPVAIDVIALPGIVNSEDHTVHQNARPRPARNAQPPIGINRMRPNQRRPIETLDKAKIGCVNDGNKPFGQGYEGITPNNMDRAYSSGHFRIPLCDLKRIAQAARDINQRVS
jgi:hypothetical protein